MAKASTIQTSFTTGEVSPRLRGRVDLDQYYAGAETLLNFTLMPHGGIQRRAGLRFIAATKHPDKPCRLIPFEFSTEQAYVIEAGDLYFRFFKDQGQIVDGSGVPYEIVTPYTAEDLAELSWAQSADTLFLCHPAHRPMTLTRTGHTDWALTPLELEDGPWLDENKDSTITITPGATGELVVNGLFTDDVDGWVDVSEPGSSLKWDSSGWANLISDGAGYAGMQQEIALPGGVERHLKFDVQSGPIQMAVRTGTRNAGKNVAIDGTASASSYKIGHEAANAFTTKEDSTISEEDSTSWAPETFTVGQTWLQYVFPEQKLFDRIMIGQSTTGWCESLIVQHYDGTAWVKLKQFDNLQQGRITLELDAPINTDRFRIVFNSKVKGTVADRPWVTICKVYDVTWTFDQEDIVAEASYYTGAQDIVFKPAESVTAFVIFRHNADAARSLDSVSIPTDETASTLTASKDLFDPGHVGASFRLLHADTAGYCRITEVSNPRTATVAIINPFGSTEPTTKWREGAWSDYRGWPRCVTFHEARLWFASTPHQPQHLWASVSSDYYNFAPGTADDDAITVEIVSNHVNAIRWLRSAKALMVGTVGAEWRIGEPDASSPLTPATVSAKRENNDGSALLVPVVVGSVILFVQRAGRKLRELAYNYTDNAYTAPDLTILSEHITAGKIVAMDFARQPDAILWCIRGDGALLGLTYNRLEKVVGWHRHATQGRFESVACIPSADRDEPWFVVTRTVDGQERRYVECMEAGFDVQEKAEAFFVDSGLSYQGAPVSAVSGLDHLEGCSVVGLADGGVVGPYTVQDGTVPLPAPASLVHLGLPYVSDLGVLPVEGGSEDGTSQAKIKKLIYAAVLLHRSLGLKIGPDADHLETIAFRSSATPWGQSPDLASGWQILEMDSDYERTGSVFVRHDQPLPCTVLAVIRHYETMAL